MRGVFGGPIRTNNQSMASSFDSSRRSSAYDAFDSYAEPGQRPQPISIRLVKTRRTKMTICLAMLCVLLVVWGYRESGMTIVRPSFP